MELESEMERCVHTPGLYPARAVILEQVARVGAPGWRPAARATRRRPGDRARCVVCGAPVGRCEMTGQAPGKGGVR